MLPGIGFLGSKIKFLSVHGESFDAGFYLKLVMPDKTLLLKTSGLDQEEIDKRNREKIGFKISDVCLIAAILFGVYVGTAFSIKTAVFGPLAPLALTLFAIPAVIVLGVSILRALSLTSNLKEWHACEHKSLVLLKSGLEPTVSNLNRCHASLIFCGFAEIAAQASFLMSSWTLVITGLEVVAWPPAVKLISAFYLLDFFIWIIFMNLALPEIQNNPHPQKNPFFWLFYIALLPTILPVIVLEKMFVLKKPSQERLEETARVLKEFVENNEIYAE